MSKPRQTVPSLPIVEAAEFTAALTARDVAVTDLAVDDKGTLGGSSRPALPALPAATSSSSSSSSSSSTSTSTSSSASPSLASTEDIELQGQLSKGGMGEVLLGIQRSLGREVAVKRHRGDAKRERELIIEGRLTGQLEHPNIVPVHTMLQDADGRLMLVMKKVEGDTWRELINDSAVPLERHLSIFDDVCHALAFAHARGVAHCDVKPANVMVGRFGEVYVVDWGIAVGFGDDHIADVPHVSQLRGVFGTPKYLAPEMALPGSGPIDGRTDVYIMGAILFELATKRALRSSKVITELLHMAHLAEPPTFEPDDDVDSELADICRRALARKPSDRFESIEALRVAVRAYARGGANRVLVRRSEDNMCLLRKGLADGRDQVSMRRLAIESRFGFHAVLKNSPRHARAARGLREVLAIMVRFELDAGALAAAEAAYEELEGAVGAAAASVDANADADVVAELHQRLEKLRAERQASAEAVSALERFRAERDPRTAERERALFLYSAGAAWLVTMLALEVLHRFELLSVGAVAFSVFMGLFAVVLATSAVAFPVLRATAASRGLLVTMLACVLGLSVTHAIGYARGFDAATALALGHTLWAVTAAQLATNDKRIWPATALCAASVPMLMLMQAQALIVSGLVGWVILSDIARRWRRHTPSER